MDNGRPTPLPPPRPAGRGSPWPFSSPPGGEGERVPSPLPPSPRREEGERGFTLIEAMVAMGVMLIGSVGLLGMHGVGVRMNADARVMTRATAIAQDLAAQMQLWSYDDPRLTNGNTTNDANYTDGDFSFEHDGFVYDHEEAELESQDATLFPWNGLRSAEVTRLSFTRYWNVAEVDDVNGFGTADAKRVAVIVRWTQEGGARRVVLLTTIPNPGNLQ